MIVLAMATDSEVPDAIYERSLSDPDDLITSQSRLSFSSSSLGHKDDTEFWSKTRKEMIQPIHSTPERTLSAPNVHMSQEDVMSDDDETEEAAITELMEAVRRRRKFGPLSKTQI